MRSNKHFEFEFEFEFEPGSLYVSHVVPNDGTSNAITQAILDNLDEKNVNLAEIKVIGCDGTNVNTSLRRRHRQSQRTLAFA